MDSWPEHKEERLQLYRFTPSMGGGVFQDRTVFKGSFELFQYTEGDATIEFHFPETDETVRSSYLIERVRDRGLGVIIISHNMEDVRAVADRIVVLRLGRNNGVFTRETSHQNLVAAITGAAENSVSRRQERLQAEAGDTSA